MTSRKWSKIQRGDVVELKGAEYTVTKAKRRGDLVRVTVTGKRGTFTRDVPASSKVALVEQAADGPLHDEAGGQRRWARPDEAGHWQAPASDPAGRAVETILGGRLVATTRDGERWLVPPVDMTTVRAHLSSFHGIPGNEQPLDEASALAQHRELHELADHRPAHEHEHVGRVPRSDGSGS